jgi:septation ring formation regulator
MPKGVSLFIQSVNEELKNYSQKKSSGQIEQVVTAGAPAPAGQGVQSWPIWLVAIGVVFAALFIALFVAYSRKKQAFKEVDEVDEWRMKVAEQLNSFEMDPTWKKEPGRVKEKYLAILTSLDDLKKDAVTDIELILVDAEETIAKFRFKKGREIIQEAKNKLFRIEEENRSLHTKLDKLKETLNDAASFKEESEQLRQKTERRLDELRIQYGASFHTLKECLNQFERDTQSMKQAEEQGEFEEVKERVQLICERQKALMEVLQKVPLVRQTIEKDLDQEIRQLDEDCKEMLAQGYAFGDELFTARVMQIRGKAEALPILFEEGKILEAEEHIMKVREEIESVYQTMEEIVASRQQYRQYVNELPYHVATLRQDQRYLMDELNDLAERYQVEDGEAFHYFQQIPEVVAEVENALEQAAGAKETGRYERHSETLGQAAERVFAMMERRELVMNELKEFRKGETIAREELQGLRSDVSRVEQQLKRLHLPGIPESVKNSIQVSRQAVYEVEAALQEIPLNMQKVDHFLKEAKERVIGMLDHAADMVRDSQEAEQKIQRLNRFRRYDKELAAVLTKAEQAFRNTDYEEANSIADQAAEMAEEKFEV